MALGAWSSGRGPLHRKLSDAIRRAVEQQLLLSGDRLPSERDLATRLLVSRSTVVTAYDTLRTEGVLDSRQGSGTRVAEGARRRIGSAVPPLNPVLRSLLDDADEEVISLACAINPAHPLVAGAMATVAAEAPSGLLTTTGYQPLGLAELRAALAEMHTGRGLPTRPEQVLVTTGAQQAIDLCASLFLDPGDRVVVESPGFPGTIEHFRACHAQLVAVPVDDEGLDAVALQHAVADTDPAAVYVMPSFHNPTGAALPLRRREKLAEIATATGVPLIEDNALEHNPLGDPPPPPVAALARADAPVLTVGSFSKLLWGGLRVGWIRGPDRLIDRLAQIKVRADLGTPLFDQAVAAHLLGSIDRIVDDRRAELRAAVDHMGSLLEAHLPDWEWRVPEGGPSLWVRVPLGTTAAFAQVALRHGVEVVPGEVMSATGEHRRHLRLPYTAAPDVREQIVTRLASAWTAYAEGHAGAAPLRSVVV